MPNTNPITWLSPPLVASMARPDVGLNRENAEHTPCYRGINMDAASGNRGARRRHICEGTPQGAEHTARSLPAHALRAADAQPLAIALVRWRVCCACHLVVCRKLGTQASPDDANDAQQPAQTVAWHSGTR